MAWIPLIPLFLVCFMIGAYADVLFLENGNVYLGELKSTGPDGVVFSSFGDTKTIRQSEVVRMDKDLSRAAKRPIEIELKDGSVLRGELLDYDDEIGVHLKTDFGKITLPSAGIKSITDTEQKTLYGGHPLLAGVLAGYYLPQGDFKSNFSSQPFFSLFGEVNSFLARGLYFGADFSYLMMEHASSQLDYNSYQLKAYASYRYLGFRGSGSFYKIFIPFVSVGAGLTYITMEDSRSTASVSRRNQMDPVYSLMAGVDTDIYGPLLLRVQAGWFAIHEESKLMQSFAGSLGIVYRLK